MQRDTPEDDGLEAVFAAARLDAPPPPRVELLNRILADAADHRPPEVVPARPVAIRFSERLRNALSPVGGWPAVAALGLCAALGLTGGLLGGADRGSEAIWNVAGAEDEPATAILAFYDLASQEG